MARLRETQPLEGCLRFLPLATLAALLIACGSSNDGNILADPLASPSPGATKAEPEQGHVEQQPAEWDQPPRLAEEPGDLAEQLANAERAIRDPSVSGRRLAWMAQLQQAAYRRLVEEPQLRQAVWAALPPDVLGIVEANLTAGIEHRALIRPTPGLPPWRIVQPIPPEELLAHYRAAEAEFGVPWYYLASINLSETFMGRIRATSVAGAQGPMQFIPSTWAAYGEGDVNNHSDAIRAAARYLRANGAPGNMANALYRYNPSEHYVRSITAYAEVMKSDAEAFRGYYHWEVYYLTTQGDMLLPVGYGE